MQSQPKWYFFRHGMTWNWKWNNLQHIQICIRSGKWKRIKYLREIVSRYAITAKMVLFQTRNDVKLKMKQFTTHSNLYQVGQVKKNLTWNIFECVVNCFIINLTSFRAWKCTILAVIAYRLTISHKYLILFHLHDLIHIWMCCKLFHFQFDVIPCLKMYHFGCDCIPANYFP